MIACPEEADGRSGYTPDLGVFRCVDQLGQEGDNRERR